MVVHCVGEALWDLRAARGASLAEARSLELLPGGAAVNTAVALARSGVASSICVETGDDALGRALTARVASLGVETCRVRVGRSPTPLFFLGSAVDGGREIVAYRRPADESIVLPPPGARFVHLAQLHAHPGPLHALVRLARRVRRDRALFTIDVNARPRVFRGAPDPLPAIERVLAAADVVKASDEDLRVLLPGLGEVDAIAWMRARMRPSAVLVVTRGKGPVTASGAFGEIRRAPRAVASADATGAGDAFSASLVGSLVTAPRVPASAEVWTELVTRAMRNARAAMRPARRR